MSSHSTHVSTLVLDARSPSETLGFLRGKAFLIYISNVYDNLPTDEIVRIGGQVFRVMVRAYLPAQNAAEIADSLKMKAGEVPALVGRLLHLGPELLSHALPDLFPDGPLTAVAFWKKAWEGVCLEERYVPIEGLGPGEVTIGDGGPKVVGLSQRRTAAGAWFQCVAHRSWDPVGILGLLALPGDRRASLSRNPLISRRECLDDFCGFTIKASHLATAVRQIVPSGASAMFP